MMEYIGTLGPACADKRTLTALLEAGMTALRLNLSHGGLDAHPEWLEAFAAARLQTGRVCGLILDLQGRELRCENSADLTLDTGAIVELGHELPMPEPLLRALRPGMAVVLDDGKLLLRVQQGACCRVERGGLLRPRKSAALEGVELSLPPLTTADQKNLRLAAACGVTAVMLSFARSGEDVRAVRAALDASGSGKIKIIAKVEDSIAVKHVGLLAEEADFICIARGDLGNQMPLWKVPAVQKHIAAVCRERETPFYVATQLLSSLESGLTPTRAEMNDIFNSVLDGACGFFLTGETAVGCAPANAMAYLHNAAAAAQDFICGRDR